MYIFWTLMIAVVTAIACALCGTFLVVKREAFVSEGLSHAVLPGIIVAFLMFQDRSSPWLILFAGLTGLVMVWLVQAISKTKLVDPDASLGIVFSGLFSIGVILASLNLKNVHFHAHCIIDGDIAYAALQTLQVGGISFGPKAFVVITVLTVLLILFITVFFKELKLMAFDEGLSKMFGLKPTLLHTIWLALVSITAVAAFEVAGTVLVVSLMIAPAAAANLLTNRLSTMFFVSAAISIVGAIAGVLVGHWLNVSPAGPIASMIGLLFLLTVFFAPKSGICSKWKSRKRSRLDLLGNLIVQLVSEKEQPIMQSDLLARIHCRSADIQRAIERCCSQKLITTTNGQIDLTDSGRELAGQSL